MAWTLEYARSARKFFEKLDPKTRHRIRDFIENGIAALDNPREAGKALKGPLATFWRYRVGDYRIICDVQDSRLVVLVITIGHRGDI
ncbi:type II toxin-antitoxin system RelE/ParE family toxin [Mesorhizobium opportunistum]|uniref:Type II toxin-antitoxin system RelE/ParE family toxin n=1 Tax=Mesorhizobium opportunistum TaxID=593909 RepID=A0ABV1YN13_9HYPH|nr:type II toxin-antitoxin system RelE/ParE family toxin [Mesorhizobium sp.]TJU94896.1 MAG: type II toxin-antitoxin system RelE/ParE family toxin [Mesorhizobium sp.]TJV14904.1 MAG: type II toxin-antitoxin system RelE/ParE family toxin [Mesorhizobium sp.]TJV42917.1 MAG: type II toxin-antitoxin system RelE/ParE family toxin [Mesorhizobium sp.]